jgi:hypothetical protein
LKEDATTIVICRSINRNPSPFSLSFTHMSKADPSLTHTGKFFILHPLIWDTFHLSGRIAHLASDDTGRWGGVDEKRWEGVSARSGGEKMAPECRENTKLEEVHI